MRQGTNRLRKAPAAAMAKLAQAAANAASKAPAPYAMPLDLRPLLAPYREHKRFTLRIENLPQLARLSAGQNNGDNTWSLALDELEELLYFLPEGFDKEHALTIRLVSKDETGASTIALIDFRVPRADDRESASPQPPPRVPRENETLDKPLDGALREDILRLEATLAEREVELNHMRASSEQMTAHWQRKLDESLLGAESAWKIDETTRTNFLKASLQEEFEQKLADVQQRAQADAETSRKWDAVVFRRLQQELASTKDMLAERDAEFIQLQEQQGRLRQKTDAELSAAKAAAEAAAAETLRDARAAWQRDAAKALADATQRCELAEAALVSARAAATRDRVAELAQLRDQLEGLRQKSQADISAAKEAAERGAAERLRVAETEWQERAAMPLAEMTARWEAAEAALALARADGIRADRREAELAQLRDQLEGLRQKSQADISAAKEAAELGASERLSAAIVEWQERTARPLAEMTARWQATEAALASARAMVSPAGREAEPAALPDQLEQLRRKSEADIVAAKEAAECRVSERLKAAEAEWRERAARPLAEMTARCQAAEADLALARTAETLDREVERTQFQDQLESLLKKSQADIAAAKEAAEQRTSERLKAAEAEWQERAARPLAEMTARCQAAEAALASARATGMPADREADRIELQDQFESLRQKSLADIAAVKEAAELRASEKLKTAEAEWRERAARSMAELTARCQAAETALAAARADGSGNPDADAYVRSLNLEIKSLQTALVDREAELASVHVSLEQMRLGITAPAPAAHWKPLPSLAMRDTPEQKPSESHLVRDVFIVFVLVLAGFLALPRIESLLPDDLRAQIASLIGPSDTTGQEAAAPAPAAPPAPPKPVYPVATVARSVNMRAQPAVGAAVIASLKRGAEVAILERNGNWDRVQISGTDGTVRQGWVFGSYLGDAAAAPVAPAIEAPASQAKAANEAAAAPAAPASEAVTTQAQPAGDAAAAPATPASDAVTTQAQPAGDAAASASPASDAAAPQTTPAP